MAKIQDVAKRAGVSISTVSRVLNGKDHVNEDVIARVRIAAQELQYQPSHAARALRANQATIIGTYWLAVLRGEFMQYDADKNLHLMKQTDLAWPHAFTRFTCSAYEFVATYASNHIHAVYGDWVNELRTVAELLGIEAHIYGEK